MQNQIFIFSVFLLNGFLIGLLFDIFRTLRKAFKTSDIITNIEDILFWVISGLSILYNIFKFNKGELRSYIFLGILLGAIIYLLVFSKAFIKISLFIIKIIKKVVYVIIIVPIKFLAKIIRKIFIKPFFFIFVNVRKILSNFKLNLIKMYNKNKKSKLKKDLQ